MTRTDFIKAKGKEVYSVNAYNFHFLNDGKYTVTSNGEKHEIHITKITIASAGQKRVTFRHYKGMSKTSIWFTVRENYEYFFLSLDEAVNYAKSLIPDCILVLHNAFINDYEAYKNDTPVVL